VLLLLQKRSLLLLLLTLIVDLICLPLFCLDVIFGMNWLSSNCAIINFLDKTISNAKQPMPIDSSMSNSIVSVVACLKSLVYRAQGYMFLFSAKMEAENDMLAISIVHEFQNIFPREVSDLPPNMVEFNIDLVPRSGPYQ